MTQADITFAETISKEVVIMDAFEKEGVAKRAARHREAAEAASKAREAALVEALTVAANRLDLWHVSAIASGNEALRCKLANWCEEARAAITKEPDA